MRIHVERDVRGVLGNIVLPIFIIDLFGFVSFSFSPCAHESRITVALTLLLTLTAFMGLQREQLPFLPYMTCIDYILVLSMLMFLLQSVAFAFQGRWCHDGDSTGFKYINNDDLVPYDWADPIDNVMWYTLGVMITGFAYMLKQLQWRRWLHKRVLRRIVDGPHEPDVDMDAATVRDEAYTSPKLIWVAPEHRKFLSISRRTFARAEPRFDAALCHADSIRNGAVVAYFGSPKDGVEVRVRGGKPETVKWYQLATGTGWLPSHEKDVSWRQVSAEISYEQAVVTQRLVQRVLAEGSLSGFVLRRSIGHFFCGFRQKKVSAKKYAPPETDLDDPSKRRVSVGHGGGIERSSSGDT